MSKQIKLTAGYIDDAFRTLCDQECRIIKDNITGLFTIMTTSREGQVIMVTGQEQNAVDTFIESRRQ